MKKILIISPHLDDAVLSCGDLIDKFIQEKNIVDVVTIFSGKQSPKNLSSAAIKFHNNCFLDENAMDFRKLEDNCAHNFLKCGSLYFDYKECLYRKDKKGFIYPDLDKIYHLNYERDKNCILKLSKDILNIINNYDEVYAPLGLGNHADHLLVNNAIQNVRKQIVGKLYFYEEVAYVCYYYREHDDSNWGENLKCKIINLSNKNYKKKIEAILMYRSQLNILWKNYSQMISDLDKLSLKYKENRRSIRLWYYDD